jgi:hypothetical protein
MNWKKLLTNINPFKAKEEVKEEPQPKEVPPEETASYEMPFISPKDAVKAIPEEMIENLKNYKSVNAHNYKLDEQKQLELMELIARYATNDEINEYFISNHKVSLSVALIMQYKRTQKWKPIIKKLREKYLLDMDEVGGSHKRVRQDRRERIYSRAVKKGDLKNALLAVKHQEEEAEGKTSSVGGVSLTYNQYNMLSDEELEERRQEIINKVRSPIINITPKEKINGPDRDSEENQER